MIALALIISGLTAYADYEPLRQEQLSQLQQSPFHYCNLELAQRFLHTTSFPSKKIPNLTYEESIQQAEGEAINQELGGWSSALIPSRASKETAYATGVLYPRSNEDMFDQQTLTFNQAAARVKLALNANPCSFDDHEDETGSVGFDLSKVTDLAANDGLEENSSSITESAAVFALCQELVAIHKIPKCMKALSYTVDQMRPRGSVGQITMPHLYQEVIGSGSYDSGLKTAALKLLIRYSQSPDLSVDLFSDLKQSFTLEGANAALAETMTWKTLALISTGGANFTIRLEKINFHKDRWLAVTALSSISSILPALDHKYAEAGRLYSWPKKVHGTCDTSKEYHFWLAAYLSRQALMITGDPEVAVAVAYSSQKAYQNIGNLTNRSPGVILKHAPFTPAAQVIRMDLAYALNGALFGAGATNELDVDKGIQRLTANAGIQEPLTDEQLGNGLSISLYNRWSKTFAPNSLFEYETGAATWTAAIPNDVSVKKRAKTCKQRK